MGSGAVGRSAVELMDRPGGRSYLLKKELQRMNRRYSLTTLAAAAFLVSALAPAPAHAQLWSWTKDQLTEYTKAWTGERMPDGRPKVSDALIERAKGLSRSEERRVGKECRSRWSP